MDLAADAIVRVAFDAYPLEDANDALLGDRRRRRARRRRARDDLS